ncbi:TPA: hypothetical protein QBZ70_001436 [Pasteurella multocida]|nr:hypothetical protein [Pasteurella multocida]HDR0675981.1 hypothetical protein [Pasteurella multocida]HDR0679148.1 hypothetical protein [Pasteurella multocida]HDR0682939.1 hypothetical protein [Pasteurella multocida]HDR0693488.1 hypothetical protein [Pasteurella multocida]
MSKKTYNYPNVQAKMGSLFDTYEYMSEQYRRLLINQDWVDVQSDDEEWRELTKKPLLIQDTATLKKYYKKVKQRTLSTLDINQIQFMRDTKIAVELEINMRDWLADGRLDVLSQHARFRGRKAAVDAAGQIRRAFVRNHISTDVFNCIAYNLNLRDPFYWLELTIADFLSLEENLEQLIKETRKANEIGKGNEGYDEQVAIRAKIIEKLRFVE